MYLIINFPFREASTKKEWCSIPRKRYLKINKIINPELTTRMFKSCLKSDHPSVHICNKKPKRKNARKDHKLIKGELKKIRKREKSRKRVKGKKNRSNNKKQRRNKG